MQENRGIFHTHTHTSMIFHFCYLPVLSLKCSPVLLRKKHYRWQQSSQAWSYWSHYSWGIFFFFFFGPVCFSWGIFFFYPLVLSYLVTHSSGFVVKLCIKVNVKTRKMCNLQGVSFYSLLQWRLSTTVSQPRLCSAWKLMCSAGPHRASLPHSPLPFSTYPLPPSPLHTRSLFILLPLPLPLLLPDGPLIDLPS